MQIGIVGLGRMGANIGRRLMSRGHQVIGYDASAAAVKGLEGATGATSLEDVVAKLAPPRAVWVMLPSGKITEETIAKLGALLSKGDVVIDGGNSFWKDDVRRAKALREKGITYLDVGTSGGVWGAGARLLHDDRRREGVGGPAGSHLQGAGAGRRRYSQNAEPRKIRSAHHRGLHACRRRWCGAFRQDGA